VVRGIVTNKGGVGSLALVGHRILQRINMVAGAYGLRLISQWTLRLNTRFLISYNNKGVNTSLSSIGGVGAKPEEDVYLTSTQSAGTIAGQGSSLATLNNLSSVSVNPAQRESFTGDATYYVPNAWGTHEVGVGFYLQPQERSKVTTYYANGGGIIQQDAALNNVNDPTQGFTIFHTRSANNTSGYLSSHIGANDYAWYVQDRWHPSPKLSITAGLRLIGFPGAMRSSRSPHSTPGTGRRASAVPSC
jgi:hypothetical protein